MRPTHPDRRYQAEHSALRLARPANSGLRVSALAFALFLPATTVFTSTAHAQLTGDLGFTYVQERAKFVGPETDNRFYLRGATIDYTWTLPSGVGLSVSGTGLAVTNLRSNIDIHQATFLVGPRYTYNLGHIVPTHVDRKGSAFVEGKFGYTFATTGQYPDNTGQIDPEAAALTYSGGAGINFHVYERFDLRLIEVDYIRTQLPNGGSNIQNTLRFASGVNFHFGY
jgi:Outer membrane protein beta-barrel domain